MSLVTSASRDGWSTLALAGEPVARVRTARNAWQRGRGLLGRRTLSSSEGLIIPRCSSVHTWFMMFPIDLVYLDDHFRITKVVHRLRPWRFSAGRRAASVLELAAGTAEAHGLSVGDLLESANGE